MAALTAKLVARALVAIPLSILSSASSAAQEHLEAAGLHASTKDALIAGSTAPQCLSPRDRRMYLSEVLKDSNVSAELKSAVLKMASVTVEISGATLNDERLNDFTATAWIYDHSATASYAVTNRHNVNKGMFVTDDQGNEVPRFDRRENPTGARVDVTFHEMHGDSSVMVGGTVVYAGSFTSGINGDIAIIRLDKRFDVQPPAFARVRNEELIDRPMIIGGFAGDMQCNAQRKQLVVDTRCKGVKNADDGFLTTCLGYSGVSGGWALAKSPLGTWELVGIPTKGDGVSSPSHLGIGYGGASMIINIRSIAATLRGITERDKANPRAPH